MNQELFDRIIERAEELRRERPDKNRDRSSSMTSGQIRSLLEALLEEMPAIFDHVLKTTFDDDLLTKTSCHDRGDNIQNCHCCPDTDCNDNLEEKND
jgi:hypothetical protein